MANEKVTAVTEGLLNELKLKGFKAYEVEAQGVGETNYARRDFFKVGLLTGHITLKYSDKDKEVDGTYLFFGNPHLPYASLVHGKMSGFVSLFTERFFKGSEHRYSNHQDSVLYHLGNSSIVKVDAEQAEFLRMLFLKMISEQSSPYEHKDELIRTYLSLIIQEALKLNPVNDHPGYKNASTRLAFLFLEMLERQFPVENIRDVVKFRTAQDFADQLNVHVNYLNRAVKEITGKSTTAQITDRIVAEAKALLQSTDWAISDIAYSVGFEYPTYFNKFFKKNTGQIPKSYRATHSV